MRRPVSAFGATLLALVLAAVPAAARSPVEVAIRTLSYDPVTVNLAAQGTTVRWSNVTDPNRLHDVVSSLTGYFRTSLLSSGESFEHRFSAAGTSRLGTRPWHKWERYRYVLLRQDPGAASLTWWRVVRHNVIELVPEAAGEYHFAARLKDVTLGRPSGDTAVMSLSHSP